jgi:hypothetical protein
LDRLSIGAVGSNENFCCFIQNSEQTNRIMEPKG